MNEQTNQHHYFATTTLSGKKATTAYKGTNARHRRVGYVFKAGGEPVTFGERLMPGCTCGAAARGDFERCRCD